MDDSSTECIKIHNKKIVEFYNSHPGINFEKINLILVEILKQTLPSNADTIFCMELLFRPEEKHKMDEIAVFLNKMRSLANYQIQRIIRESTEIRKKYICEFRSISCSNTLKLKENNDAFSEKMKECLSGVLKLRTSGISDRTNIMLRQFHKILHANIDSYLSPNESEQTSSEYISNFDSNTQHMINAICGLITEYISSKEKQSQMILDSFRKKEDASSSYYKLIYELNDFLQQFEEEDQASGSFDVLLSKTFPTASIISESESKYNTITRENKKNIFIEMHKTKDQNIGIPEVKSFLKTAMEKNVPSILVSNYAGISSKSDYQIEIRNNHVIIYLHRLSFHPEKLKIATDMIDSLSGKLEEFCVNNEYKYSIPKEVLDDVNREYQQFITQKESIICILKDQHKRILSQFEDIRFLSLDKFLLTRYSSCKKQGFICDLCCNFEVPTLKGLAAHKRGCIRKRASMTSSSVK